jgi:peroxiredoxin
MMIRETMDMRQPLIAVTLLLGMTLVPHAQQGRNRIDVSALGPQVGERVPDFTLSDQNGTARTLASIMGRRGAMLVFIRSADWCPYCKTQLLELQGRVSELQEQGLGLATISYDSREILAAFATQHGITFPMLADPVSETITRYGLLNTVAAEAFGPNSDDPVVQAEIRRYISEVRPSPNMQGMAYPGTLVLDRQGRVTSRFFEDFYVERSTVSSVLKRVGVEGETVAGTRIATQHMELTTYPSDTTVAPGNRFALMVEITPKPGMHVYAPGASNYRVVSVRLAGPSFLRFLPLSYPPSEIYHFKPLDERVPVYQRPFTLVQELVLEGDLKSQAAYRGQDTLIISGTLEYQACDDRICYNPVSVPLSWTVGVRSLVMQRPAAAR